MTAPDRRRPLMKPAAVVLAAGRAPSRPAARLSFRARRAERRARKSIGMPARHPERLTAELPEADEEWLAGVAAELWPDDEYAQIIAETRREDR
jgi:predicted pyridoxine 5'-phosphate oxidase superfamily flavin-nucleotide-binding protein